MAQTLFKAIRNDQSPESCARKLTHVYQHGSRKTFVVVTRLEREYLLSEQQHRVWAILGQGASQQQIADDLGLSFDTVKAELAALRQLTGVTSSAELICLWHKVIPYCWRVPRFRDVTIICARCKQSVVIQQCNTGTRRIFCPPCVLLNKRDHYTKVNGHRVPHP